MNYQANIKREWHKATAEDLEQGLAWYGIANDFARAFAASDVITREQAAGVIAAMSPMMSWGTNIHVARRLITRYLLGEAEPTEGFGLKRNVAKAWRILRGEDPLNVLSGDKVRAFYSNIIGDPTAVTVDRWAARAARGNPDDAGTVTKREYREIADAYRAAAADLDISARDLQAAVWVAYRRQHARATLDNPTTQD